MNLKHVYNDYIDMLYDKFCTLCRDYWLKYGFLVINKDSALANGRYRKGFNEFMTDYNVVSRYRYFAKDMREHEKIVKEIEKRNELIKKHHALTTGRIDEDIALNRYFKSSCYDFSSTALAHDKKRIVQR